MVWFSVVLCRVVLYAVVLWALKTFLLLLFDLILGVVCDTVDKECLKHLNFVCWIVY